MRYAWNGKNKFSLLFGIAVTVLICIPGCDDCPTRPGEGFYSYRGFRDWWRIPLRFPYQITVIDSFEHGTLEKYDPDTLIAAPECTTIAADIVEVGYNGKFATFKRKNVEKPFGILIYASGATRDFATEDELARFIARNYPGTSSPEMAKLEEFYDLMWRAVDKIMKTDPKKLVY